MKKLLKLLDKLPFDGDKTKIGAWLTSLFAIWGTIQQLDPELATQLLALLTAHPINWPAIGVLIIGLAHGWLKRKFGRLNF